MSKQADSSYNSKIYNDASALYTDHGFVRWSLRLSKLGGSI
jgi:hypothetical protein